VSLDQLWAGWRSTYVSSVGSFDEPANAQGEGAPECVFCTIMASSAPDSERNVLWTGKLTTVLLNAYPYCSGHLMVLPIRHARDLCELDGDEMSELSNSVLRALETLKAAYHPEGVNLGLNIGRAAGAGIPAHLHVHIVPRWVGDTNFMTAVAGARVIPESLGDSWSKLRAAWA